MLIFNSICFTVKSVAAVYVYVHTIHTKYKTVGMSAPDA